MILGLLIRLIGHAARSGDAQAERQKDPHHVGGARRQRRLHDDRPMDPDFEQLAGRRCRRCKESVVAHSDATLCPSCKKPVHHRCLEGHVVTCGIPQAPYR